jgi:DNA-binding YbaB/EbfC family protein
MKNFSQMMKQVQEMQSRMQDIQARLEQTTVTGQAGGGLVKATLNGKGALKSVTIDPTLLNADEREILEDLIVAAHADAKGKMETLVADQMKELTGGLPLPPGFELPS